MLPGVGLASRPTPPGGEIIVVPLHFLGQTIPGVGVRAPGGQHLNAVPNLGDFAEHDRAAAANDHIRRVARAGVGGDAAESVAAAALHTNQ